MTITYTSWVAARSESEFYYEALIGSLDDKTGRNDDVDAFRHAYVSGVYAIERGKTYANILGWANEIKGDWLNNQPPVEKNMDLWNNRVGRELAETALSKSDLAQKIADAINNNELIIDPFNDSRQFNEQQPEPKIMLLDDLQENHQEALDDSEADSSTFLPDWLADALQPIFDTPGVGPAFQQGGYSPLVLDIDRSGTIDLTAIGDTGSYFDFWGDGYNKKVGWVAPQDGLLALDVNGNGSIDHVSELFGTGIPLSYFGRGTDLDINNENGFVKLAIHDSNSDGVISALDDIWDSLLIWQDADQDGVSDDGELVGLDSLNIASIDVAGAQQENFQPLGAGWTRIIEGNTITHTSSFAFADGSIYEIVDAWFDSETMQSYYAQDYTLDVRTLFLPTLRGYGQIADLHVAMSADNGVGGLLEQVQAFATTLTFSEFLSDADLVRNEVEAILYRWAGIDTQSIRDNPDYSQHGHYGQIAEFFFIRKFMGIESDYSGTWFDGGPNMPSRGEDVIAISKTWNNIVNSFSTRLIFQAGGSELFGTSATYNPFSDIFEGTLEISQSYLSTLAVDAASSDQAEFWHSFVVFVEGIKGIENLTTDEVIWISTAISNSSSGTFTWADVVTTLDEIAVNGQSGDNVVNGTQWDDRITGFDGDETLIGGAGDDILIASEPTLYAGANDILDGGLGNDVLYGGGGDDIYRYNYGHDVIAGTGNADWADFDIIEFGVGIDPSDVSFHLSSMNSGSVQSTHAVFEVEGRGSISIALIQNPYNHQLIDELHFADGTIISNATIPITLHGTNGSDPFLSSSNWGYNSNIIIYGYDGDDDIFAGNSNISFIDGGEGNDNITGSSGNNTLLVSAGNDKFWSLGGNDKILLPEGFDASDLTFYRYSSNGSNSSPIDALIEVEDLGTVSILNQFTGETTDTVHTLEFSNNSTLDLTLQDYITIGSAGDDVFTSSEGNWSNQNTFILFGEGNDALIENAGEDSVIFGSEISPDDISLERVQGVHPSTGWSGDNLIIKDGAGNSLHVINHFSASTDLNNNDSYSIEKLKFDDGQTIYFSDIEVTTYGTDNSEHINGATVGDASSDDLIYAYGGDDTLSGGDGNDKIYGGLGNDFIYGDDGLDTASFLGIYSDYTIIEDSSFYFVHDNNVNDQDEGQDRLQGIEFIQFLDGIYDVATTTFTPSHMGPNIISGTAGNDVLTGTVIDDEINGLGGSDVIEGSLGNDIIDGGNGNDLLSYENISAGIQIDLSNSSAQDTLGAGVDTVSNIRDLRGSNFDDVITGNNSANRVYALDGDDTFEGGRGNDWFYGGDGNDTAIFAADFANYGLTDMGDHLSITDNVGNEGSDKLYDVERLEFNDGFFANGIFTPDTPSGGGVITGTAGNDQLNGTVQDDEIYGLEGNDTLYGSLGADILDGGAGNDTARYEGSSGGVFIDIENNVFGGGDAEGDTLINIKHINGSHYDDVIRGNAEGNLLNGQGGDDVLIGGDGLDTLKGSSGADRYVFEAVHAFNNIDKIRDFTVSHDDIIDVSDLMGAYDPTVHALSDFIQITNDGTHSYLEVDTNGGGNNFVQIAKIENLTGLDAITLEASGHIDVSGLGANNNIVNGTAGDDQLSGTIVDDALYGIDGRDTLYGSLGADIMDGGSDKDSVNYSQSSTGVNINLETGLGSNGHAEGDTYASIEWVFGSHNDDVIRGDADGNLLNGFGGDDVLIGGDGKDTLKGATGADTYVFESASAFNDVDNIRGFKTSENDVIDISDVLIGYDPLSDAIADFVQITDDGQHSYLEVDAYGGANNFQQIARIENTLNLDSVDVLELNGALKTEVV